MLPREFRLPNELIRVVNKRGVFVSSDVLQIKYAYSNHSVSRFSFIVSKKLCKKATDRNRNKRWLRIAALDTMKCLNRSVDAVIILKRNTSDLKKKLISHELNMLLQQINSRVQST